MCEQSFPESLLFHPEHTWLRIEEGNIAYVGISAFAQEQLGEVAYVDLPAIGSFFSGGESFGSVESLKAVNELYMPTSGKILEVNGLLSEEPSLVNTSPHTEGWMLKIEIDGEYKPDQLMDGNAYSKWTKEK